MTTQGQSIGHADAIEVHEIDPDSVVLETVECPYCGAENLSPGCILSQRGPVTIFSCWSCERGWTRREY